eukprot:gene12702-6900_t
MKYEMREWLQRLISFLILFLKKFSIDNVSNIKGVYVLMSILVSFQIFSKDIEKFIVGTDFLQMILLVASDYKNVVIKNISFLILFELCNYKSNNLEKYLSAIYNLKEDNENSSFGKFDLTSTTESIERMTFDIYSEENLNRIVNFMISNSVTVISKYYVPLLGISGYTKTNFDLVDRKFKKIGKIMRDCILNSITSET